MATFLEWRSTKQGLVYELAPSVTDSRELKGSDMKLKTLNIGPYK